MPKGYIVITEDVKDPGRDGRVRQAGQQGDGRGDDPGVRPERRELEGEWHGTQTVLLEFESVEAAREWYNSDAYQEAAKLRQAAADCNGAILTGLG